MPVHGIDDGNNKHAVYTAEEVLAILQQAIDSGSLQGIDPEKNPIVAAVRESHNNSNLTFWSGTEAEFNEMTGVTSELIGARIGSDGRLYLLTGDTTLSDTVEAARQAALEATEGMKREVISVTLLANGWSNTAPYTQTVAVAGMTADKDFLAPYVVPTGNESDDLAAQAALSCISGGTTDTDSVTFYCYDEKPTTTITVFMVDKGTKIEPGGYPIASKTAPGIMKVGDGLNVDENGEVSCAIASTSQLGAIKVGDGLEIENDGTLSAKISHFVVTSSNTQGQIQALLSKAEAKIVEFEEGNYTFTTDFVLNANTTILLNNSTLTFPSGGAIHGFHNYKATDEFLEYNGNGNIAIIGGTIVGGACSFCHAKNILFRNLDFVDCNGQHILEMMAINGLHVDSCTFEGQTPATGYEYREMIQIDDCARDNFPWFNDENNPTYDGTPNKNWVIENCQFLESETEGKVFYTAIGGHTYIEDSYHENILIRNNVFDGYSFAAIRLRNVKNSEISNNSFKSGTSESTIDTIRGERLVENILIEHNTIDANETQSRVCYFNTQVTNFRVRNNNIFNFIDGESVDSDECMIVFGMAPDGLTITDNFIHDSTTRILYIHESTSYDGRIEFSRNTIDNCTVNGYLLRIYRGEAFLLNNYFGCNYTSGQIIRLHANVTSIVFKGNTFKEPDDKLHANMFSLNAYAGSLADVEDIYFQQYSGNVGSLDDQVTSQSYAQFNTLILICGSGTNTQTFKLKGFNPRGKLTARTYKLPAFMSDGTAGVISLVLNSDYTIDYSCTVGVNIRVVYFANEKL